MVAFSTFLRDSPRRLLRRVIEQIDGPLPAHFDWATGNRAFVGVMLQTIASWDADLQARVYRIADRISEMADEIGQTAMRGIVSEKLVFDQLSGGYERALTMFLDDPCRFRRAEEARFTDHYRIGRLWTGFTGAPGLEVLRDDDTLGKFKSEVGSAFESDQVHIDIFERTRPTFEDGDERLVQISIYREGLPDEVDVFVNGELSRQALRPAIEAGITYDRRTGVTEVVGPDTKKRVVLARIFTETALNSTFTNERVLPRLYNLEPLRARRDFMRDAQDGIEGVWVVMMQLSPLRGGGQQVTVEVPPSGFSDIWGMLDQHFGRFSPLQMNWVIKQARLIIRFLPRDGQKKGRVLPVTIRGTDRCDLKGRNHDEQLVSRKYLRRWKLLADDQG